MSLVELEQYGELERRGESETLVIPVIEEFLKIQKRQVETGRVRIRKVVQEREETVNVPLLREEVSVERVPVNRYVDGPLDVRYEGDIMIVPVVEEVLVVEKRLVLKEELHISKRQVQTEVPQTVILRSEEAFVERLEGKEPHQ
ncbi:MAG: YsnF/AvaK domain-containing protein [Ardenticatenales bacterium]|nr:YsnF/AvaK domain-containing protein [Ardenticatenales bacterium]